jgi:hypothetical protein
MALMSFVLHGRAYSKMKATFLKVIRSLAVFCIWKAKKST